MNHTLRSIIEEELQKAYERGAIDEREECADLVDEIGEIYISEGAATLGLFLYISAAIRARGDNATDNN